MYYRNINGCRLRKEAKLRQDDRRIEVFLMEIVTEINLPTPTIIKKVSNYAESRRQRL